jgi:hypothetical protein
MDWFIVCTLQYANCIGLACAHYSMLTASYDAAVRPVQYNVFTSVGSTDIARALTRHMSRPCSTDIARALTRHMSRPRSTDCTHVH